MIAQRAAALALLLVLGASCPTCPTPLRAPFVGFNLDHLFDNGTGNLTDPSLQQTLAQGLADSAPGARLRWPGGGYANYYNWRTGTVQPAARFAALNLTCPYTPARPVRLADFLALLASQPPASAYMPLLTLNVLSSNLSEQMALVDEVYAFQAHRNQLPQQQQQQLQQLRAAPPLLELELGNELFIPFQNYEQIFPTVADYARLCEEWITALRARFPRARIALNGAVAGSSSEGRRRTWNAGLLGNLSRAAWPDALTFHVYQRPPAPPLPEPCPGFAWGSAAQQQAEAALLASAAGQAGVLAAARAATAPEHLPEPGSLPGGLQAWVSEWGLIRDCGALRLTWGHGLATLSMAMGLAVLPGVEHASLWVLTGNLAANAVFPTADAFSGLCCGWAAPVRPAAPSALGTLLGALARAARNATEAESVRLDAVGDAHALSSSSFPGLQAVGFRPAAGQPLGTVLVANLAPNTTTVSARGLLALDRVLCTTWQVGDGSDDAASRFLARPNGLNVTVAVHTSPAAAGPECSLPPFGVLLMHGVS